MTLNEISGLTVKLRRDLGYPFKFVSYILDKDSGQPEAGLASTDH